MISLKRNLNKNVATENTKSHRKSKYLLLPRIEHNSIIPSPRKRKRHEMKTKSSHEDSDI